MNVHFALPRTQDEAEFTTENPMAPGNLGVRWVTPGPGREELNQMLAELLILEVDHLAVAAANGESYRVEPLRELAVRDGWSLHSKVGEEPALYQLQRDGESTVSAGPRTDLLLILELLLRMALQLYEGQPSAPTWVARAQGAPHACGCAPGARSVTTAVAPVGRRDWGYIFPGGSGMLAA